MGRIHLLADDVINKIAAGEVVERPASVVKELVENACDAGATAIDITLELGGARTIAVTDNGCGMSADDALLAIRRHATSKVTTADDLFQVRSMGFRGEALAAIAAVSRFTLSTRERGADEGVKVTFAGESEPVCQSYVGPEGTTVLIENLFFNVPARHKFLKSPSTELSHGLEFVQAFALSRPDVAITVRHNGRDVFRAPALAQSRESAEWFGEACLRERVKAVLGRDLEPLLYVRAKGRFGAVEGLISPPGLERPTSRAIHTFVNGRWVKDKVLRFGILRGYHSHLLKGRFPVACLHLTVDPALVDVNVHPAKTEVRFQYGDEVQSLIALAIRDRIRTGDWAAVAPSQGAMAAPPVEMARPAASAFPHQLSRPLITAKSFDQRPAPVQSAGSDLAGGRSSWPEVRDQASLERLLAGIGNAPPAATALTKAESPLPFDGSARDQVPWDEVTYVGAFARCFLLLEAGGRLLVVDQHAFHERILYERLVRDQSLLSRSQPLLVPEAVALAPSLVAQLAAQRDALAQRGFDLVPVGDCLVEVHAVPALLAGRDLSGLVEDLAEGLLSGAITVDGAELAHHVLATTACHGAVRAGEELPAAELKQLLAEARTVDFFHNCPHGRRVFRWWSRSQVAQWFDR